MFGGMAFKVGMLAKKSTGGGSDVIPDTINFGNIEYNGIVGEYLYTEKQITGINQTITLKVTFTAQTNEVYYAVNAPIDPNYSRDNYGDLDGVFRIFDPATLGLTLISNNGTFTVNNNDWICFGCYGNTSTSFTITVKNNTDSDTTLDTFTATINQI